MRAMIVTILIPDDWTTSDICTSCNIGIREYAQREGKSICSVDYNTMVIEKFTLANPEFLSAPTPPPAPGNLPSDDIPF